MTCSSSIELDAQVRSNNNLALWVLLGPATAIGELSGPRLISWAEVAGAVARAVARAAGLHVSRLDAVFDVLEGALTELGFTCHRWVMGEPPDGPTENMVAIRGEGSPHFGFAGHLDVVPPGRLGERTVEVAAQVRKL